MLNRINLTGIIKAHLKTLRSLNQTAEDSSVYWGDKVIFFAFPIILSCALSLSKVNLSSQVSNLIAIISIFGGFLFNLLAIIYSYIDKINTPDASYIKKRFANEINSNISFCILLSIFIVLLLLFYSVIQNKNQHDILIWISLFAEFIIYFLLTIFFLTLLMVLSRVFILLQKEGKGI